MAIRSKKSKSWLLYTAKTMIKYGEWGHENNSHW